MEPIEDEAAPVATDEENPPRGSRGDLEAEVKEVTDAFAEGKFDTEGKPLTPHRIANAIVAAREADGRTGRKPSTGAVTDTLKRWKQIGFANVSEGPWGFDSYTDDALAFGLTELKVRAAADRKARKAARAAGNATPAASVESTESAPGHEVALSDDSVEAAVEALDDAERLPEDAIILDDLPDDDGQNDDLPDVA